MIQCPGSPASSRLCRSPLTKLSSITTTITTSAIPSAVISEVVRRTIRLRRLYVIGIAAIHDRVEIRRQTKFIPVLAVIDRVRPRGATLQVGDHGVQPVGWHAITEG